MVGLGSWDRTSDFCCVKVVEGILAPRTTRAIAVKCPVTDPLTSHRFASDLDVFHRHVDAVCREPKGTEPSEETTAQDRQRERFVEERVLDGDGSSGLSSVPVVRSGASDFNHEHARGRRRLLRAAT